MQTPPPLFPALALQVLPGHAKLQIMHPVPRHAQAQEQHHHRHRGSRQESEDAPQAGTDAASSLSDTERGLGAAVDIGAGEAVFSVPLSTALVVLDEVDVEPSADAPAYLRLIAKLLGEVAKVPTSRLVGIPCVGVSQPAVSLPFTRGV